MADLVVVVPSRGRPEAAAELAAAFAETCTADTELVFALDDNDDTAIRYPGHATVGASRTMNEALNATAWQIADAAQPFAIAFMGDDHRPRTKGWDAAYLGALRKLGTGLVYGDDLLRGESLPSQVAMTSDIVRALGYMAPPCLTHLFLDNFWLSLGRSADCIRYLPDVVVEHVHPQAGKAEWDAGYERVNSAAMYSKDEVAFRAYAAEQFPVDVAKVKALRAAHV